MSRHSRELSVGAALIALLGFLAVAAPGFFEPQPLLSRSAALAPKLIVACGVALVMITRQIDISVGSIFAVCSVTAGSVAAAGAPFAVAVAAATTAGAALGAVNGALVAGLGLPSIVVTLGMMVTLREAVRLWTEGVFINLPDGVQWLGLTMVGGQWTICGIAIAALVVLATASKHLAAGRFLYAIGSDAEAARLAGLRPRGATFCVFLLLGALTGFAAALHVAQSPQVDPAIGRGLEMEAIAAAVVGGVAVSGGRGSLWGVFAGAVLLACVNPALTYLGVKPYWDKAIQGAVILLAVAVDGWRRRREMT